MSKPGTSSRAVTYVARDTYGNQVSWLDSFMNSHSVALFNCERKGIVYPEPAELFNIHWNGNS
jgi:hypothetical protein